MELVARLLAGDRRAVARLITLIENDGLEAQAALAALYPHTGRAHVVGITGAPGTGKSTLVNELTQELRRQGRSVGIIAVDPTSPFTGGAILGDRIRMQELTADPGVFIRSMATRGSLGGLARATGDAIKVLDAFGKDVILVETVGVGQDEVEIAKAAQTTVVVETPGLGDDVQMLKAGVLEIADVLVVNKADLDGADRLVFALETMLSLNSHPRDWQPPVVQTVALRGSGIPDLWAAIERHRTYLSTSRSRHVHEQARAQEEIEAILRHELTARLLARLAPGELSALAEQVARREIDPYTAARWLMERCQTKDQ
jgi:LAO/AO transport system kinase